MTGLTALDLYRTPNQPMVYYALLVYFFQCQHIKVVELRYLSHSHIVTGKVLENILKIIQCLEYHKDSMEKLDSFVSCFENPSARIDQSITNASIGVVSGNRKYLSAVIRAIEYCGRQGIALRGHRDDGFLFD